MKRAIQLRDIVTSLGPAYIKLGQALSIRPDILSPAAMNELQKLCDKVPSFDNAVAMQVRSRGIWLISRSLDSVESDNAQHST